MSPTPEHRHDDLRAAIGVQLGDELLTLALTHRSYAYENGGLPTNERLEFLGDAVLGLTITETLYHSHPDRSEGDLAKLRASIVNTQALAGVARGLTGDGLGAHLLLGKGEENTGGRDKSSILADGMESILGAVYLEHGLETARAVVLTLFGELLETAPKLGAGLDWKTSLQELTAEKGWGAPSYAVTSTGPDHDKEFTATVMVNDTAHGVGVGRSKKEAEQKAAAEAWNSISGDEPLEGRAEGGDEPLEGRAEGGDEPLEGRAEGGDEPLEGRAEGGDEPLEGRAEGGDEPLEGRAEGTVSA